MRAVMLIGLFAGCQNNNNFDPPTYVSGPRLLTVTADPPEVSAGDSTALHAFVVDPQGRELTIHWSACFAARSGAAGAIADDCVTNPSVLQPIGDGADAAFTMPPFELSSLGLPDATGGFYFPIRIDFSAGSDSGRAFYRLRMGLGFQTPNHNPVIVAMKGVAIQDTGSELGNLPSPVPFAESTPIEVGEREGVRLQAELADGSDESYSVPDSATTTRMVTEQLRVIWYASAGTFSNEVTGLAKPDTVFRLDKFEPAPHTLIDLWAVVTDERGGQAITHRSLLRR